MSMHNLLAALFLLLKVLREGACVSLETTDKPPVIQSNVHILIKVCLQGFLTAPWAARELQPLQQSTEQQIKTMNLLSVSTNMSPRHGSIQTFHCSAMAQRATVMTVTHVRMMQGC